jgi:trimethylamine--corrinoid protein Co-methyltransferase
MQSGRYGGSTDGHALRLGLCEIARFYNLPVNLWGLSTTSGVIDVLYGYEATTACLLAVLSGADEIYSMGLLGSAQILSLEKMVLDNHLAHQIATMKRPLLLDEDHLQAELIERVGVGGHYLRQRETREYTRREYIPVWPPAGKSLSELVRGEALEIAHHHQPPALPKGVVDEFENLLRKADGQLKALV